MTLSSANADHHATLIAPSANATAMASANNLPRMVDRLIVSPLLLLPWSSYHKFVNGFCRDRERGAAAS
uniref:Uncharacterized protein n=1 Tax=Magnetospirillum gryphiswaldense TaxID=55518 RepID=A4U4B8_9PROT|nr:hypothetical protein MGR_3793 [Magnetospirillum gryphiswaldense MSR-1]